MTRAIVLFCLLNFCDFGITYLMLDHVHVYESNPLARLIIESCGWIGLGVFKLASLLLMVCIANYIYRREQMLAVCLVHVGSVLLLAACLWSLWLQMSVFHGGRDDLATLAVAVRGLRFIHAHD